MKDSFSSLSALPVPRRKLFETDENVSGKLRSSYGEQSGTNWPSKAYRKGV